jgi:hypothetical protein
MSLRALRPALLLLVLAACQPLALGPEAEPPTRAATEAVTDAITEPVSAPVAAAPVTDTARAPASPGLTRGGAVPEPLTDTLAAEATDAASDPSTDTLTDTLGAGATGAVTGTLGGQAVAAAEGAVPSANPLSPLEQERANALVLDAPETEAVVASAIDRDAVNSESVAAVEALSDRPSYRILYTQRAPDKTSTGRGAEVAIYRYDTDQSLMNNVDLVSGKVTAQALPEGYVLPLVPDEITEASTVAKADPRVQAALAAAGQAPEAAGANGLLTRSDDPASPCATHRCLRLFFSTEERPAPAFSVIVDLSTLNVVEVEPFDTAPGSNDQ